MWSQFDRNLVRFKSSRKKIASKRNEILKSPTFEKFISVVPYPWHFTLKPEHLGLSQTYSEPEVLYEQDKINVIKGAIKCEFKGCLYYAIQVGRGNFHNLARGRLHIHILAAQHDGPEGIQRPSERCKPSLQEQGGVAGWIAYLNNPPEPCQQNGEPHPDAYLNYKRTLLLNGRAPRLKGWLTNKARVNWNQSHCSIDPSMSKSRVITPN